MDPVFPFPASDYCPIPFHFMFICAHVHHISPMNSLKKSKAEGSQMKFDVAGKK